MKLFHLTLLFLCYVSAIQIQNEMGSLKFNMTVVHAGSCLPASMPDLKISPDEMKDMLIQSSGRMKVGRISPNKANEALSQIKKGEVSTLTQAHSARAGTQAFSTFVGNCLKNLVCTIMLNALIAEIADSNSEAFIEEASSNISSAERTKALTQELRNPNAYYDENGFECTP